MTVNETEEKTLNTETEKEENFQPTLDDTQIRAAALAYARFLKENDLTPESMASKAAEENAGEPEETSEEPEAEEKAADAEGESKEKPEQSEEEKAGQKKEEKKKGIEEKKKK